MRRLGVKTLCLGVALLMMGWVRPAFAGFEGRTGFRFDTWNSDIDSKGMQIQFPFSMSLYMDHFTVTLLSGYAYTRSNTGNSESYSISSPLDTKVSLSYELLDKLPVDVLFGLDFNLPTGKTNYDEDDLSLVLDPDLVGITVLGEGFNVNPTLSIAKQWGSWTLGLGIGWVWRMEYDYSRDLPDYDPGEIFNVLAQVRYEWNEEWSVDLSGEMAVFSQDEVKDDPYFHAGNFYRVAGRLMYRSDPLNCSLVLSAIYREKNEILNPNGDLRKEEDRMLGDEYSAVLRLGYALDDRTSILGKLYALYVEGNDYPRSSVYYMGSRKKYAFGMGLARDLTESLQMVLFGEVFTLDDGRRFEHESEDMRANGVSLTVSLTSSF